MSDRVEWEYEIHCNGLFHHTYNLTVSVVIITMVWMPKQNDGQSGQSKKQDVVVSQMHLSHSLGITSIIWKSSESQKQIVKVQETCWSTSVLTLKGREQEFLNIQNNHTDKSITTRLLPPATLSRVKHSGRTVRTPGRWQGRLWVTYNFQTHPSMF